MHHINALRARELFFYYDLFLAARSAPSQLCLHDTACSGCSYTMLYIYRTGAAGGERSEPPACIFYVYPSSDNGESEMLNYFQD